MKKNKSINSLKKFFKNKKIFITGHTGFKGIWLVSILNEFNARIFGYSKKDNHTKNFIELCNYPNLVNIYGNILNKKKLLNHLKIIKPEIIIHFAAQSLVQNSYENPEETIQTNVIGTVNLLDCCRTIDSVKTILIATSDKCYENSDKSKDYFTENDKLNGDDPYSASKACKEILFNAYYKSYFRYKKIGITTVRAGNVIGGADWSENRILPDCARSIINNRSLIIRNHKSIRPWQHVLDVLNGYLILIKKIHESKNKEKFSGSYNFGPSEKNKYSVNHLVKLFFKSFGIEKNKLFINKYINRKEKKNLLLNSKKSKKILNWEQKIKIKEAISLTSAWYKAYIEEGKNLINVQVKKFFLKN